jgi:Helix-turn-helix domain/Domain of unknown function (DUF4115)
MDTEGDATEADVVVRRRGWLMGAIAAVSAGLAAGYLWRFAQTAGPLDLTLGIGLGLVAVCYGYAWTDARIPLFVADRTGLRIRLGSAWTGVPWELVRSVEVEERGRIRDGQVLVLTADSADMLADATRRSRWAAWLNRWLYDAPLVVPFGLTTDVSVPSIAGSLEALADQRAPVVVVNGPEPEPEVTVEIASKPADPLGPIPDVNAHVDDSDVADPDTFADSDSFAHARDVADGRDTGHSAGSKDDGTVLEPAVIAARGRRRLRILRGPGRLGASSPAVSDYTATPARREDVTIAARTVKATAGSLALSEPASTVTEHLPEIDQLRRPTEPGLPAPEGAVAAGNVSLIIDATTDLTSRAMQRVREPRPIHVGEHDAVRPESDIPMPDTVIGSQLTEARVTLGLTIDELAERTRIRPYVIESIEVDDFSPCGGDFYARGHLRMLSRVLGIDETPLLTAYDERFASSPVNARKVFEVELATGSTGMVRGTRSSANWGALIAAVLVLLLVWGVARYVTATAGPAAAHTSTSPPRSAIGSPGPGNQPVVPPAQAQVKLTATGAESRVRVSDRLGHVVFSGVLAEGTSRKVSGQAPLRVHAADAGAVSLSVRGKPLGPVGDLGVPGHRLVRAPAPSTSQPANRALPSG